MSEVAGKPMGGLYFVRTNCLILWEYGQCTINISVVYTSGKKGKEKSKLKPRSKKKNFKMKVYQSMMEDTSDDKK